MKVYCWKERVGSTVKCLWLFLWLYYAIMLSVSAEEDQSGSEKVEVKVETETVKSGCVNKLQRLRCCLCTTAVLLRRALWGVAMVICICASWTGCTQLAKITIRRLNVPFTLTWFSTSWNCAIFPLYYLGHLCCSKDRQSPKQRFRWDGLMQLDLSDSVAYETSLSFKLRTLCKNAALCNSFDLCRHFNLACRTRVTVDFAVLLG